jgi:hypothetical protein
MTVRNYFKAAFGKIIFIAMLVILFMGTAFAQKSLGINSGGGSGGGTNPLPPPPPAPGLLYRDSLGLADLLRPTGGKGTLKDVFAHKPIAGFWIEYPGSKNTAWLAPGEGQTWRFAASSDNPYEMPSPIQATWGNGSVASEWFDPVTEHPTALMPFSAPSSAYEISLNGYPAPIPGAYLGLGFTDTSVLYSNLETSASVWLLLKPNAEFSAFTLTYELRVNGVSGPLLASGETYFDGWNRMALRYDPVTQTVSASINGTELGSFAQPIARPRYVGFEGVGIADNFVVKTLP